MNHVIIVAGGIGSRMNLDIPKQFYEVNGDPIILYSIKKFASSPLINSIVIVLADEWVEYMKNKISEAHIDIPVHYAKAGKSRQHSVYNGLLVLKGYACYNDVVLIHDSVRPLFPLSCISDGISACVEYDGCIPVIPVKDATYLSHDGIQISDALPRQELFSGQSPECFLFGKLFDAHSNFKDSEISSIRGCSELALKAGLTIKLINGSEGNFKITTIEDLSSFQIIIGDQKRMIK